MTFTRLKVALRRLCLTLLLFLAGEQGAVMAADGWASISDGTVVLFRHALAPGGGDPPGHTLDDCGTQRNLSGEGKAQARRIGAQFRNRSIAVGEVWSSQWCRTPPAKR